MSTGDLFDATEPYVHVPPEERFSVTGGGHLLKQLLQSADSFVCQSSNVVEVLADAVLAADVHLTVETVNSGGGVQSQIRLWAPQDGTVKILKLARGGRYPDGVARFDSRSKSAEQILARNDLHRGSVEWDFSTIVNAPIVLGDVKKYEFTLPLVPGWKPEQGLDNVDPADRPAAKAVILLEEMIPLLGEDPNNYDWYRKYHRFGNDFRFYKNVGRKWVLNEAGTYGGATYNRNAPFDDYQPFDWSTVADSSIAVPGQWSRRKRRFLDSITREAREKGSGIYPEVSFDSGTTWYPMLFSGVMASLFEVGVYFATPNLTSVTPPWTDPLVQNMWWAIIDQTFRVRVTGLIEADDRLIHQWSAGGYFTPSMQLHSRVVDRSKTYLFITREGVTNEVADPSDDLDDLAADDTQAIASFAAEYVKAHHDRRVFTLPAIPWIETDYGIGDQVSKIQGREIDLSTRIGHDRQYPTVVGLTYRLDERLETELRVERPDALLSS